jgi:hypothetical protein
MSSCWAASIGNCNGGISREHVVSKALFKSPTVSVDGFPWCKGKTLTIGIESLTAKILCQRHNNNLSPLDEEASALFDAIREWCARENVRNNMSPLSRIARPATVVNARLLERWFLKTLLNLSLSREYYIGINGEEKGVVPLDLVQICYGMRNFEGKAGMYGAAHAGMMIASHDTLRFAPLLRDERVLGGFFEFRGFRFFLSLMPDEQLTMSQLPSMDTSWQEARLMYPIELIQSQISSLITVPIIRFKW